MIAVVAAIAREVGTFLADGGFAVAGERGGVRFFESGRMPGVAVAEGGMGAERADAACRLAIERYRPELVVSAGFAGAARPGASAGDTVLCTRIWALSGPPETWSAGGARSRTLIDADGMAALGGAAAGAGADWGECVTVDRLCADRGHKAWLGEALGVDVIDMESYWVSEAAAERGLPHMVVRTVLDPAEEPLPSFAVMAAERGEIRSARAAAAHLVGRPGELPGLLRLWMCARRASSGLGRALATLAAAGAQTGARRLETA